MVVQSCVEKCVERKFRPIGGGRDERLRFRVAQVETDGLLRIQGFDSEDVVALGVCDCVEDQRVSALVVSNHVWFTTTSGSSTRLVSGEY